MRRAEVYMGDRLAGILEEGKDGFTFTYTPRYRRQRYPDNIPVTKTMPVREEPYFQERLFPFFDNLPYPPTFSPPGNFMDFMKSLTTAGAKREDPTYQP